ncbi:dihydrofolate reductase family protein [Kineococcus indalonis]|uniref:dihydrofolate reductase family protein n=1 Tax=Kineococcus indalonis TaxID=2696566 RepID=UPI001412C62C|nr:dihydrofolate reductase family protein [Kineococcus indalonis]NAZ86349.1 deaminase [Kineococcus indalonis]
MHELVVVENVSLDGVAQSPGRPDEDTRGGFALGGWASRLLADDPEAVQAAVGGQGRTAAMLFGRRTYHDLVGHWLGTDEPNPFTEVLRSTPKFVTSRSGEPRGGLPWPNSQLLVGEAVQTVAALKQRGEGELVVLGSLSLVRELTAAGLVDRFVLTTLPVVLGRGTRLFGGTALDLRVESSTTSAGGGVVASYRVRRR